MLSNTPIKFCMHTLFSDKPCLSPSSFLWQKQLMLDATLCRTHPRRFLIPIIDGCHQRTKGEEVLPERIRGHSNPIAETPTNDTLW